MSVVPWVPNSYFDPFSENKKIDDVVKSPISIRLGIDYIGYTRFFTLLCTPVVSGVLHY